MLFKGINCNASLHMNLGIKVEMNLQGTLVQTRKWFRFLDTFKTSVVYPEACY